MTTNEQTQDVGGPENSGSAAGSPPAVRKDAFYIRQDRGGHPGGWEPLTDYIGKTPPEHVRPRATCAMRVFANQVVTFSLHQPNKTRAKQLAERPVKIPVGALTRLERRSHELGEFTESRLVLEHQRDEDNAVYELTLSRDENNVVSLSVDNGPDDGTISLRPQGERMALYLRSPKTGAVIASSFMGYLNRPPGSDETVDRAAAKILNSLVALPDFYLLSDIESVRMGTAPDTRQPTVQPVRVEHDVTYEVPVWLFSAADELLANGRVYVQVDLENANPNPQAGHLLYRAINPSEEIAELFPAYQDAFQQAVNELLRSDLGQEHFGQVTFDIVLGSVDERTVEQLRAAGERQLAGGLVLKTDTWDRANAYTG